MSILDTVFRRREPAPKYRTIDGGHPAPYPDMTDAQLYAYETTFNVPQKTFDKPPNAAASPQSGMTEGGRSEPRLPESGADDEQAATDLRTTAIPTDRAGEACTAFRRTGSGQSRGAPAEPTIAPEPAVIGEVTGPAPALDWSKPVRTVTTRQPVEIITTKARHPVFKVLGYIGDDQVATMFTLDGQISENGPRFLENMPQKQLLYLNIYPNRAIGGRERFFLTQHETKEGADAAATGERLACVVVEFDLLP